MADNQFSYSLNIIRESYITDKKTIRKVAYTKGVTARTETGNRMDQCSRWGENFDAGYRLVPCRADRYDLGSRIG
ncbi:MAG: hypothetical protein EOM90_09300 [Alphaproteobacteria bacterium]|nr:hypothetical protein [Alphaproteobacteria bacterium]